MSKLSLKTRESKASKGSEEESSGSKSRLKAKSSGLKPASKLASSTKASSVTAMDTEKKAASSLYSFSKFASGEDSGSPSTKNKPARFSERYSYAGDKDGGGNLIKILIFIGVIIALGLGIIYFIQNDVISNIFGGGENTETSSSSSSSDIVELEALTLSNLVLPDADGAATGLNSDYSDVTLNVGSVDNENEAPLLDHLTYQSYDSFTRLTWDMLGVEEGFPATQVSIDEDNNIVIEFTGVTTEQDALLQPIVPLAGSITLIEATQTADALVFNLNVVEPSKYYLDFSEDNYTLVMDVKTQTQLESPSSSSSSSSAETSESSSTSSTTSSATSSVVSSSSSSEDNSGSNKLENSRSQGAQEIVNTTSGVNAVMENYSYQDFGPRFEFNWEFKGETLSSVPDVTAEIIQNNGTFYIEVKLSNVGYDLFYGNGFTQANFGSVDLTYSNLKNVLFRGREGNTSTYWVELGGKEDYQLTATEVSNAGRRRVKIVAYD